MKRDSTSWTAAPRPTPVVVTAGAFALLTSAGLFLINAIPLFYPAQYEDYPASTITLAVVFLGTFSLALVLIPLLAALFALRGSRWPAFLAAGFAFLMTVGVIGANPIYIGGAIAALVGAVLLWLPTARAYRRTTMRNRHSQGGLIKRRKPVI